MPASTAHRRATHSGTPFTISATHTTPPVAMVPSTVKSATSSTL